MATHDWLSPKNRRRVSKVRVGIRVSVRIRVSLVLVTGWGKNFQTWSEWSYMSGSRRLPQPKTLPLIVECYYYVENRDVYNVTKNIKAKNVFSQ